MWSLYEYGSKDLEGDRLLPPLVFSNGKTQADIVDEVVSMLKSGVKVVFIKGGCGTGKSAIALNIAKELGRASIVVPVKNLQKQYQKDYLEKMYILKDAIDRDRKNKEKLKISVITGRKNHICRYMEEKFGNENGAGSGKGVIEFKSPLLKFDNRGRVSSNSRYVNNAVNNVNSTLGIFDDSRLIRDRENSLWIEDGVRGSTWKDGTGISEKHMDNNGGKLNADYFLLPCTIEMKERNRDMLKRYISENNLIRRDDFEDARDLTRISVAGACPYWSPVLPGHVDFKIMADAKKEKYTGLNDVEYIIYKRKAGCPYYGQFMAYKDADVIIFNSFKYVLENAMMRKPATDVEIIDECDEFLDSFSNEEHMSLNKSLSAINALNSRQVRALDEEKAKVTREIGGLLADFIGERKFNEIFNLGETKMAEIIRLICDNAEIFEELDEEEHNYLTHCYKVARVFEHFIDDAYISYKKLGNDIYANIVTIDLARMFNELLDRNKAIVLMSGTLHSSQVLKDIFGLKNFSVVEAETRLLGRIERIETGLEIDCRYENFQNGSNSREDYLAALSECIRKAKRPTLVHVNSFFDLPSSSEKENYHIDNLMTREELRELQDKYKEDELVREFKDGRKDILFSTKCNRGVDFPGEICNSIVLTKYPYPDVKSLFWEILKRNKPQYYWEFYKDKAYRELLQRVYRGLRSKDDVVQLLSPDIRVLRAGL